MRSNQGEKFVMFTIEQLEYPFTGLQGIRHEK